MHEHAGRVVLDEVVTRHGVHEGDIRQGRRTQEEDFCVGRLRTQDCRGTVRGTLHANASLVFLVNVATDKKHQIFKSKTFI